MLDLTKHVHCSASRLVLFFLLLYFCANPTQAQVTPEGTGGTGASGFDETPEEDSDDFQFRTVRTDSPRHTLTTFLRLRDDLEQTLLAYRDDKTRVLAKRIDLFFDQLIALLDLSSVPRASQREVGTDTTAYLLDIFGRVELPKLDSVPDEEAFADEAAPAQWRIPRTPIRIAGITEGAREGEFLFSERTVRVAPRFYRGIQSSPLQSRLGIKSWSRTIPQITGPMVPAGVLAVIPDGLKRGPLRILVFARQNSARLTVR